MPFTASFIVRGVPKAQPRGRAAAFKGSDGQWRARVHNPDTAEGWKSIVAAAAAEHRPQEPLDEPVEVHLRFYLPRPKSRCRRKDPDGPIPHTTRPDGENLEKAVIDTLMHDGWFRDDSIVWRVVREKVWCAKDNAVPRLACRVTTDSTFPVYDAEVQ